MAAGKYPSRASIWIDVKFPLRIASRKLLGAGETGVAGGSMPILMLSSTSPRLDVGICDNGRAAIRVLLFTTGCRLIGSACFGGLAIKGGGRSIRTSSMNRPRRRAASRGVAPAAPPAPATTESDPSSAEQKSPHPERRPSKWTSAEATTRQLRGLAWRPLWPGPPPPWVHQRLRGRRTPTALVWPVAAEAEATSRVPAASAGTACKQQWPPPGPHPLAGRPEEASRRSEYR